MARSLAKAKGRRDGGLFVPLPCPVLVALRTLSPHASKLLLAFLSQLTMSKYGALNNGDLSASLKDMQKWGIRSPDTLNKCKKELLDRGLICETRKGAFPNKCSLYALTFYGLNDCEGKHLEITQQSFPRGAWRLWEPGKPVQNTRLTTSRVSRKRRVNTPRVARANGERSISSPPVSIKALS